MRSGFLLYFLPCVQQSCHLGLYLQLKEENADRVLQKQPQRWSGCSLHSNIYSHVDTYCTARCLRSQCTRIQGAGCYRRLIVLSATSIIVVSPRNEKTLFDLHHDIAARWGPYLDHWTKNDFWQPHTTLMYSPQIDLQMIAEGMRKEFRPFLAQVTRIELSLVTENGYKKIDSLDLPQR